MDGANTYAEEPGSFSEILGAVKCLDGDVLVELVKSH